jgi:hypothetical protein
MQHCLAIGELIEHRVDYGLGSVGLDIVPAVRQENQMLQALE